MGAQGDQSGAGKDHRLGGLVRRVVAGCASDLGSEANPHKIDVMEGRNGVSRSWPSIVGVWNRTKPTQKDARSRWSHSARTARGQQPPAKNQTIGLLRWTCGFGEANLVIKKAHNNVQSPQDRRGSRVGCG